MKKYLLILTLFLQTTFMFAQSEWTEYGSWTSDGCFPQIMWRLKVMSNPKINTTSVMVEFKNNYPRKVNFMFHGFNNSAEAKQVFADKGNLLGGQQSSLSLNSGQSTANTFSIKGAGANKAYIEIYTLYFDNDYQHYQKCIGGSPCLYCQVNSHNEPACPNYSNTSPNNNSSSSNSTYNNKQPNYYNSNTSQPGQTTTNSSSQSNQVINTSPDNTTTELLNVIESTTNLVTSSLANTKASSAWIESLKENELKIKTVQEEFAVKKLSDKEIDSLLENPKPNNYASINIYNKNHIDYYVIINGKKLPSVDNKNEKLEYRIYDGTKLVIQAYRTGNIAAYMPIQSITTSVRKGKEYHFIVKKLNMYQLTLEQIDEEPLNKKGEKVYESINRKIKSDIDY